MPLLREPKNAKGDKSLQSAKKAFPSMCLNSSSPNGDKNTKKESCTIFYASTSLTSSGYTFANTQISPIIRIILGGKSQLLGVEGV